MTDKATLDYSALVNVISNEFRHYNTGITSASIKEKILLLLYIKYLNDRSTAGNEVNLFQELPKEASWSLIRESATDTNYKLESAFWALAETNRDFQKLLAKFPFDNNPFQKELDAFLFKITQCLSNYDLNISQENFGLLFDQLFKKLGDSPSFEDEIMPRELVDLMLAFKPNKDQPAIYNPYAGLASIPIALKGYKNYFGQTLNKKALSIAELRLLAYGINQEFQLESTNPIEFLTELGKDKSYDFIISNPPFRVKLNKLKSRHSGSGQKMLEGFLLEQSAKILSEQGVAVVAVSGGFLSSGGVEQKLRQQLIESDLVETVVALPVKLFEATGIPIYLVVLNKNKANRNKVRFIDASEFLIEKTKRLNHIDIAKVLPLIKQDENSKSVHFSDTSEIKKNDFNLTPKRYIPLEFESSTSKDENTWLALNKVLERISPYRIKEVEKGRFIRISNLSSSIKDSQTSFDEIEETELPKSVSLLPNQCLILATKYKDLKPTYFSGNDEPVFYDPGNMATFRVNDQLIYTEYLLQELRQDYVLEQLNKYNTGAVIPFISQKDLMSLIVKVPELSQQKEIVLKRLTSLLNIEDEKVKNKIEAFNVDVADENIYLRHHIAGPLGNARKSFNSLKSIIEQQVKAKVEDIMDLKVNENSKLTFGDYLAKIDRDLESISKSLTKTSIEAETAQLKEETIDIIAFLNQYINEVNEKALSSHFKVINKLSWVEDEMADSGVKKINIIGDETMLRKVFDNIFENANKHGFKDFEYWKHEFEVDALWHGEAHGTPRDGYESQGIEIRITNTCENFPSNFSFETYIRKGGTAGKYSGDGYGGWFIMDIIDKFHGDLGVKISPPYDGFESDNGIISVVNFELIIWLPIKIEYDE